MVIIIDWNFITDLFIAALVAGGCLAFGGAIFMCLTLMGSKLYRWVVRISTWTLIGSAITMGYGYMCLRYATKPHLSFSSLEHVLVHNIWIGWEMTLTSMILFIVSGLVLLFHIFGDVRDPQEDWRNNNG